MKKLLITATVTLACVAAFAQGRISFQNDSLHLVYFTTDTSRLVPTELASAGKAPLPAQGQLLTAQLWGGTSSSSLTLQATTGFSPTVGLDGTIATKNFVGTGTTAGVPNFFQVLVFSTAAGSYANALAGTGLYYGETSIFTTVPSTSAIAYNSIVNPNPQALSTWAVGTQDESGSSYGAGAKGAIAIQANVPEPTTIALAGLGVASMLIFRRRK